jgi:hypothetical protein
LEETHVQRRISEFIDFYENINKEGTHGFMQREKLPKWINEQCSIYVITCSTARRKTSTRRNGFENIKTSREN